MSGRLHGRSPKLTRQQVEDARQRHRSGLSLGRLSRELGVARSTLKRHITEGSKHHALESRHGT